MNDMPTEAESALRQTEDYCPCVKDYPEIVTEGVAESMRVLRAHITAQAEEIERLKSSRCSLLEALKEEHRAVADIVYFQLHIPIPGDNESITFAENLRRRFIEAHEKAEELMLEERKEAK